MFFFFFSGRRRHTSWPRDWSSDVCSSDLETLFDVYTIESDSYDFVTDPVTTLSVAAALVASTSQVSPEVGYEITAATFEHAEQITLPQSELITHDYALFGQGDVPLHPGAEQYYEEQGLL